MIDEFYSVLKLKINKQKLVICLYINIKSKWNIWEFTVYNVTKITKYLDVASIFKITEHRT
jgi:hypothetical protein